MKFNQRTSGPVNAHLTPGLGIHFNAFIIVYSPMAGADNPLVTNVDVNRKPLSLCPFGASFKTISLNSLSLCPFVDTKKKSPWSLIFYCFLCVFFHMYIAPGKGRQPIGDKNRKAFSLCPYVASFKIISSKSDLYTFLMILYMYIALGQRQKIPWGQTFDVNRKPISLRPFVASFKQISSNSDFIHIF